MRLIEVYRPTLWINAIFGISSKKLSANGAESSDFLKIYTRLFFFSNIFIQLVWFSQHLRLKVSSKNFDFQEMILLVCVVCNGANCFLPLRNILENGGRLYDLVYSIAEFEKEFTSPPKTLARIRGLTICLLSSSVLIPFVFMTLESFRLWKSYSIGSYNVFFDLPAIISGFLRTALDVIFLNEYVLCSLILGISYSNMNAFLSEHPSFRSSFLMRKLKSMQKFDNVLKDFYQEFMNFYSLYCLLMVSLSFLNWFYLIGFIFINTAPKFMTYPAWVVFLTNIFFLMLGGSIFGKNQVDNTYSLLQRRFINTDDPRLLEEVEILSLQLFHRKVEFKACGFFKLDFTLLLSMIGTVTTYIIILMQFDQPTQNLNCNLCVNFTLTDNVTVT